MNKLALIALLPVSFVLAADPADRAAGHWEAKSNGATIALDLVRDAAGAWNGGLHGGAPGAVPLKNIFVAGHSVHFETPGGGFAPTFDGRLSEDGQTLTGSAKHDTELDRLTFHRTGEAHVAGLPERSTPITKALEGEWLADQGDMHLILRLANGSDGIGGGMLVAPRNWHGWNLAGFRSTALPGER